MSSVSPIKDPTPTMTKAVMCSKSKICRITTILAIVMGVLIVGNIIFAIFAFRRNESALDWPAPSNSHLGVYSTVGIASDNERCAEIARDILLRGGNAVDGAIAAMFCIGIMNPQSAGIGGGHFMTIFNGTTSKCSAVNARETAPEQATEDMYKDSHEDSVTGWRSIAVPGEIHGMWTEFRRFGSGKVEWADLVRPSIHLLRDGHPTSHAFAKALRTKREEILREPTMRRLFVNFATKDVYEAGEQVTTRQPLADFLEKLSKASDPTEFFYHDEVARRIIDEIQEGGGILTTEDLKNYKSVVYSDDEVVRLTLPNGRHVCGPPPPSGAAVAMGILNVMDGFNHDISSFDGTVEFYHRLIEAEKFAYARRSLLGDAAFVSDALDIARNLTTSPWAQSVRSRMLERAQPDSYYGGSFQAIADHGTTHISVIDKEGNAVAVTTTVNLLFGSVRASRKFGIVWNDQMDDFSAPGAANQWGFPPSPANFIRPGKRPQSSMSPLVIYDEKEPRMLLAIGAEGGSTIISGVAGVALRAAWLCDTIKEALDAPRLHNQLQPNEVRYEERFPQTYIDALRERGHVLRRENGTLTSVSAVHRIRSHQINANADFRKGAESGPAGY